jgi:predicted PurR-regulated permease PerM
MPHNERLIRSVAILGILVALVYLSRFLWDIGKSLSDLLLLLALAWLVAYVLTPIAEWLNRGPFPQPLIRWVRRRWGDWLADRLDQVYIPYALAALLLYLLVLFTLVLTIVLLVPGIIKQLGQLANQVPRFIEQIPAEWEGIQASLVRRFNVDPETLASVVPIERFTEQATEALPDLIGNAVSVAQQVANGVARTLLILILSLYIMLDRKRLSEQFYRIVPIRYQDEFHFVFSTVDRTFGGFLRGQVLMALIQGVFTGILMRLFGLQLIMITAILSGFIMFVPELGAPIAMFAPVVAAAVQGSNATIPVFIIMLVFQQILLRFIIPQVLSQAIGMPPLLILVSMLVGAKVMGLWGFFFGIPLAGAIYTIAVITLEEMKQNADAQHRLRQADEQATPAPMPLEQPHHTPDH